MNLRLRYSILSSSAPLFYTNFGEGSVSRIIDVQGKRKMS